MRPFLKLEIIRMLRDPYFLVLSIVSPIGFYLLFTSLFGGQGQSAEGLPTSVELMVAMAAFGAMWAVLSSTAPRIAREREIGWLRQLKVTPLSGTSVIIAKGLGCMAISLPSMLLVFITAAIVHSVRLPLNEWFAILGTMWLGTLPFVFLGMGIGYSTSADTAFGVTMGIYLVLAALGGLWMPVSILPDVLQRIAHVLPSNRLADLGWKIAGSHWPALSSVVMLIIWSAVLGVLALLAYRRSGSD